MLDAYMLACYVFDASPLSEGRLQSPEYLDYVIIC